VFVQVLLREVHHRAPEPWDEFHIRLEADQLGGRYATTSQSTWAAQRLRLFGYIMDFHV
jgi:hypothetical protein